MITALRSRLGAVGVWCQQLRFASREQICDAARRIEAAGYGSLWTGEVIGGADIFVIAAIVLSATRDITFGSGIANLWARHPAAMQGGANTLGAAWPGRFFNGIGVSHSAIVDPSGQNYAKPLERMRNYLLAMDQSLAQAPTPSVPVPRLLAALGPKMLELSRDAADGAHPYLVPPEHTSVARAILGPDRLLVPEQKFLLCTDAAQARHIARKHISAYLTLPNYVNNLKRFGFADDDLSGTGSDRLVDALVAWGDERAVLARITELRERGADHVVLQPLARDLDDALRQLESLAPGVQELFGPRTNPNDASEL